MLQVILSVQDVGLMLMTAMVAEMLLLPLFVFSNLNKLNMIVRIEVVGQCTNLTRVKGTRSTELFCYGNY